MPEENNEPIYSFWAEQVANDTTIPQDMIQHTNPLPQAPPKKQGFSKRFLSIAATALLFGLVASISFLSFNKLYYHYNPDAKMINTYSYNNNGASLYLDPPDGQYQLSKTQTLSSYSFRQETDISNIVEQTMPATVAITSITPEINYFFGQQYVEDVTSGGSGIIIGENDIEYLIATNSHVVSDASFIEVILIDDTVVDAYIKGKDADADLAVIAIRKELLTEETSEAISIAKLGNSDEVKVGQMAIAIGNALGYGQSVTVGYISAKDRIISTSSPTTTMSVLQVDAAINPGNSGGPLLNSKGEVIGINSAKLTGTYVEGMGYSIPISNALPIVSDLMTREVLSEEEKGYLGILMNGMSDVTERVSAAYNWPIGVYIREMTEGSAAEKAGIRTGDIITSVNDTEITTKDQLRETVTSYRHGTILTLTVMRYNDSEFEELLFDVTLQKASNQ